MLSGLALDEYNKFYPKKQPVFKADIYKYIDLKNISEMKISYGCASKKSVGRQISLMKSILNGKSK